MVYVSSVCEGIMASEEDIKIKQFLPYLRGKGYTEDCMDFNYSIVVQEGRKQKTIYADILVYTGPDKQTPLLICETKSPSEPLDKAAKEQAISYARLLPKIAPLALITNGNQVQVFHTLNKSRLADLPSKSELTEDLVRFVLSESVQDALRKAAKHELFIIDDVRTFKSLLKSCHNTIRNDKGSDPTEAFDELSKVMFCKLYEEKVNPQKNRFRTSVFDDSIDRLGVNVIRKIFEEAVNSNEYGGLFQPGSSIALEDRSIRKIVELLENYDLGLTAFDVKGEAFEYFLGETFTGGLGEFFTPRNVVEFIVDALDPKIGEKIIDPFCGTGGFLIYAFDIVSEKIRIQEFSDEEKRRWKIELSNRCLFGTDWKERTSQACKMNMMVHGDGSSGIHRHDGFLHIPGVNDESSFDLCITNPPFGSFETNSSTLSLYELSRGKNSVDRVILAVERCLRLLKPGGRLGIVVIDGLLNNSSFGYIRDYIREHSLIEGIVSLNEETFEGYGARAKTSILFLKKKTPGGSEEQGPVFMSIASNSGIARNGDPIPGNELPDILMDFQKYKRKGNLQSPQHKSSWIQTLSERLDAEYYYRASFGVTNLPALYSEIADIQKESNDVLQKLQTICTMPSIQYETKKLRDLFKEWKIKHNVDKNATYNILGVKWWGYGVFRKEPISGKDIKSNTLYETRDRGIIYNRLFAFRGSFALLNSSHIGCYVSIEFPIFIPLNESDTNADLLMRYIVHILNSPHYLSIVDAKSTGSTKKSRNRFSQKLFLDFEVLVPKKITDMQLIVEQYDHLSDLRVKQEHLHELSKRLWDGGHQAVPLP